MFFGFMAVYSSLAQDDVYIFGLLFKHHPGAKPTHLDLNSHVFVDPRYAQAVRPFIRLGLSAGGLAANSYV
jgi:hypothetical protein